MSRYTSSRRRQTRPPGFWHGIPPWIRGAFISFVMVLVLFFINGIGVAIFSGTGFTPALICYPLQVIFYAVNGMLTGWQADETRAIQVRRVGFRGETVRLNLANYVGNGALAGLVLAILAAITYFLAQQAIAQIIPGLQILALIGVFGGLWLFILVDTLVAIAFGMLGGVIYDRMFAAPGRR